MSDAFPNLHARSVYDPLRGLCRLEALAEAAQGGACAVTDGNLWAAVKHRKAARAAGARPVYGAEVRFVGVSGHLVALARGEAGWRSLRVLCGAQESAGGPGLTIAGAAEQRLLDGLVVLTGGCGGALHQQVAARMAGAAPVNAGLLRSLRDAGGDARVEVAPTMGTAMVAELLRIARLAGLSAVATGDSYYPRQSDAPAWRTLRTIGARAERVKRRGKSGPRASIDDHSSIDRNLSASRRDLLEDPSTVGRGGRWGHLIGLIEATEFFATIGGLDAVRGAQALAAELSATDALTLPPPTLPDYAEDDGRALSEADQRALLRQWAGDGLCDRLRRLVPTAQHGAYTSRLEEELRVVEATGFPGYFLCVGEFMRWARSQGIPLGPGRGSAAGSVAVWSLGITDEIVDPVRYGLMFERFLNPERVGAAGGGGLPDIDVDVCKRRRHEVVQHLRDRYGTGSVGRIINYKTLHGKTVLKDVGRTLGVGFGALNAATASAPQLVDGKAPTVAWLLANVPALRDAVAAGGAMAETARVAALLEGCVRESGVHASGVVVSRGPLGDWVPLCRTRDGELCSQWAMDEVEAAGLVKLDILGLSTVTHIDDALKLVNNRIGGRHAQDHESAGGGPGRRDRVEPGACVGPITGGGDGSPAIPVVDGGQRASPQRDHGVGVVRHGTQGGPDVAQGLGPDAQHALSPARRLIAIADRQPDAITDLLLAGILRPPPLTLDSIPLEDPEALALIAAGDTGGVFQLGKDSMRRMLREMRPDCSGDVIAAGALHRPGPLRSGMVKDYIDRKHGRKAAVPLHVVCESVTRGTYHTIVYQEQVMGAVRAVAGYSLGQADIIRKIMGKKKPELLAKERVKFAAAARARGVCDEATADRIWEVVEANAGYSFNVSHSTTYGLLSLWTAWLKAHHPLEFYAAWMTTLCDEADKYKRLAEAVYDARSRGVVVLPPCVLRSAREFLPERLPSSIGPDGPGRAQDAAGRTRGTVGGTGSREGFEAPRGSTDARSDGSHGAVRYGLAAVRGVSEKCLAALLLKRAVRPFADLSDFLRRVPAGKRDLTSLVGSGALDVLLARERA